MGFNLIYWTPICGKYFFDGSFFGKCGKICKKQLFFWVAWAATARLGSKGLSLTCVELLARCALVVHTKQDDMR